MNLPAHQLRVIEERAALDSNLGKLGDFIESSPVFQNLPVDEKRRLSLQREAMDRYSRILSERIDNFYRDRFKAETTIADLFQYPDGTFCNAATEHTYAEWKIRSPLALPLFSRPLNLPPEEVAAFQAMSELHQQNKKAELERLKAQSEKLKREILGS